MNIAKAIINFCYPASCLLCGELGSDLCEACALKNLRPYQVQECHVCRHETFLGLAHRDCLAESYLDGVVTGYIYNESIAKLVMAVKYHGYFNYVNSWVDLVARRLHHYQLAPNLVTPVPLAQFKLRQRGFNQAALLAEQLASAHGWDYQEVLIRRHRTQTQVGQGRIKRLSNLHNVFEATENLSSEPLVLLVDDVMTTGTTLEQCAKALKAAGAHRVYGLVLARGG